MWSPEVSEPMRVDVLDGVKDLRCAGNMTVALQRKSSTVIGWTQVDWAFLF